MLHCSMKHLFNVFGQTFAIERRDGLWVPYVLGQDGKRQAAQLAIPADIPSDELAQYLYDIYHESASPTNGEVFEIRGS